MINMKFKMLFKEINSVVLTLDTEGYGVNTPEEALEEQRKMNKEGDIDPELIFDNPRTKHEIFVELVK